MLRYMLQYVGSVGGCEHSVQTKTQKEEVQGDGEREDCAEQTGRRRRVDTLTN